jgi:hypothetical protein
MIDVNLHVGFEVLTAVVMKCYYLLGYNAMLVSCSPFSTLKVGAICSSKMSVDFQWTTQCYIPESSTLHKFTCSVTHIF